MRQAQVVPGERKQQPPRNDLVRGIIDSQPGVVHLLQGPARPPKLRGKSGQFVRQREPRHRTKRGAKQNVTSAAAEIARAKVSAARRHVSPHAVRPTLSGISGIGDVSSRIDTPTACASGGLPRFSIWPSIVRVYARIKQSMPIWLSSRVRSARGGRSALLPQQPAAKDWSTGIKGNHQRTSGGSRKPNCFSITRTPQSFGDLQRVRIPPGQSVARPEAIRATKGATNFISARCRHLRGPVTHPLVLAAFGKGQGHAHSRGSDCAQLIAAQHPTATLVAVPGFARLAPRMAALLSEDRVSEPFGSGNYQSQFRPAVCSLRVAGRWSLCITRPTKGGISAGAFRSRDLSESRITLLIRRDRHEWQG